ncbi:MAG: hypothetical protein ACE5G9_05620 [Nitrospinales bacterium]
MDTVIAIVVAAFLAFMVYSMIRYARFIHNYPHESPEEKKRTDENPPPADPDRPSKGE